MTRRFLMPVILALLCWTVVIGLVLMLVSLARAQSPDNRRSWRIHSDITECGSVVKGWRELSIVEVRNPFGQDFYLHNTQPFLGHTAIERKDAFDGDKIDAHLALQRLSDSQYIREWNYDAYRDPSGIRDSTPYEHVSPPWRIPAGDGITVYYNCNSKGSSTKGLDMQFTITVDGVVE